MRRDGDKDGSGDRAASFWRKPMSVVEKQERSLAEAVAILVEEIHQAFPAASTRPLPPYEDEDFALEVKIPADLERDEVMNACIRHALDIEDTYGFAILTRVKRK
jgi:hypothetical protein